MHRTGISSQHANAIGLQASPEIVQAYDAAIDLLQWAINYVWLGSPGISELPTKEHADIFMGRIESLVSRYDAAWNPIHAVATRIPAAMDILAATKRIYECCLLSSAESEQVGTDRQRCSRIVASRLQQLPPIDADELVRRMRLEAVATADAKPQIQDDGADSPKAPIGEVEGELVQLDKESMVILKVLAASETFLKQVEIAERTDETDDQLGKKLDRGTVSNRLSDLERQGYIKRPKGERSGWIITPKGRALIPH
jgi:hypothetical protein